MFHDVSRGMSEHLEDRFRAKGVRFYSNERFKRIFSTVITSREVGVCQNLSWNMIFSRGRRSFKERPDWLFSRWSSSDYCPVIERTSSLPVPRIRYVRMAASKRDVRVILCPLSSQRYRLVLENRPERFVADRENVRNLPVILIYRDTSLS